MSPSSRRAGRSRAGSGGGADANVGSLTPSSSATSPRRSRAATAAATRTPCARPGGCRRCGCGRRGTSRTTPRSWHRSGNASTAPGCRARRTCTGRCTARHMRRSIASRRTTRCSSVGRHRSAARRADRSSRWRRCGSCASSPALTAAGARSIASNARTSSRSRRTGTRIIRTRSMTAPTLAASTPRRSPWATWTGSRSRSTACTGSGGPARGFRST
jgi:hypothetical protein